MLEKEDLKQIETIINVALDNKLDPIKQQLANIEIEIKEIKQELAQFERTESEDIAASYSEIENLKQRVAQLESQLRELQATQN